MTALTVPEVLRKAEQVISERGWCQHDFLIGQRLCVLGAVNVVAGGTPWEEDLGKFADLAFDASIALGEHLNRPSLDGIAAWNDEEGRTEVEVRAALLAAAQEASES